MQSFKAWLSERKWLMIITVIVAALLLVYVWAAARPGIWLREEFLYLQAENCWQGEVEGQTLTITREETGDGAELHISCPSGERTYTVRGEAYEENGLTILQDGTEIFHGTYSGGVLLDEAGEPYDLFSMTFSSGGTTFYLDADDVTKELTPLDLRAYTAVQLALFPWEDTRGKPWAALFAALMLAVVFVEACWPEVIFHWSVGRYIDRDAEPSELYSFQRVLGMVVCVIGAVIMLITGFRQ